MWKILRVKENAVGAIADALRQEYEPFAVSVDQFTGYCVIWFKKEDDVVEGSFKELKDEVSSQSEPVKGKGRRATPKPKG